jgi:Icc-related predicted phosphoesterase
MTACIFVSDLHGRTDRYEKLFGAIRDESPAAVFIGGDILPSIGSTAPFHDFLSDFLYTHLERLRSAMGGGYPRVFIIPGNDDYRAMTGELEAMEGTGLLISAHGKETVFGRWKIFGYAFTPPSPFMLKDWEKYDVSRYTDPGCVSPEEGRHSFEISPTEARYSTISADLVKLAGSGELENAVFLFHAPPYRTALDRADLDGRYVEGVPMDVNVGSIAIRRFIEERQPLLTLHGHVHESARLTGEWKDAIGRTVMLSAAHDGPELALVRFELEDPGKAERVLL